MRLSLRAAIALVLFGFAAAAFGAEASTASATPDAGNPSAANATVGAPLEEILVSGTSLENELPQQLSQYGTRVDTITAADIQNGGYLDVASALEDLTPGLYISSKNGPFDYVQVSLQGSRTQDVLWLVDGIRVNNRLYAGTTPLDTIPSSMVERIEVLDGGQALFYGTQAVAGAVNIVTKDFTDHADGLWSLGADSNDGKHINGYFRDALHHNNFVLYASHDESPGIQPFPGSDYQPSGTDRHRAYTVTTLGAKYGYNFTDALALSALYQYTDARLDFANPYLVALSYNQRYETLLDTKIDYAPSDAFKLYAKYYYHWWSSYYTEYDNGSVAYTYTPGTPGQITVAASDDFWGFKDYGANLLTQVAVSRGLELLGGYDFQGYTGRDAVLVIEQQTERVNAVFGQIRATPDLLPDAHLAAGLRYNVPSVGQSALVWNGSGQYDLSKSLFIRTSFGTAFRLATDEELFANDPNDERGDPNLKPETSTNANLSIGGVANLGSTATKWELIGFDRAVKNLINFQSFDSTTNQAVFGNVPGTVTTRGVELTLDSHLSDALSATMSATYARSRQTDATVQFDQVPVTQVKGGLDYHPSAVRYGAAFSVVRVGDLDDEPLGVGNGRFGYGNYTIYNVSGRMFLDHERRQRLDLHLNNVFNHVYYSALGFGVNDTTGETYVDHDLAPPRTFSAYYSYKF